ncbi:MAG: TlpA disulfide reductase family protein [Lacunisphaera sp.]
MIMNISRFLARVAVATALFAGAFAPALRAQSGSAASSAAHADSGANDPAMAAMRALMPKLRAPDPAKIPEQVAAALKLLRDYPDSELAASGLFYMSGNIILPDDDPVIREQRRLYLKKEVARLMAGADTPPAIWKKLALIDFTLHDNLAGLGGDELQAALRAQRGRIAALAQRAPNSPDLLRMNVAFLEGLRRYDPAAVTDYLHELTASPNAEVAQMAKGQLSGAELAVKGKVFEMSFTALDGRAVDVAAMRGKVILIDFWATWCGPCVAELPFVKAAYAKYRDRGFEVIGVSLDFAKDRQKVVDFCRKEGLTWPQAFDGKGFQGEFPSKYGILSIPHTFLLDQEGRIVTSDTSGEKLEMAVRQLLKR